MNIVVSPNPEYPSATVTVGSTSYLAVIGKAGATNDKHEGDNATPIGTFGILQVYVRPEGAASVVTELPTVVMERDDVWCDDPTSPHYNQPLKLSEIGTLSHELLWREDHLYDIVVDLDINRSPAVPGKGSAIFMHVARNQDDPTATPTAGCIALKREDLLELLRHVTPTTTIQILEGV